MKTVKSAQLFARAKQFIPGGVNSPVLVVAPTNVKRGRSIFTERAPGPWPMMRSSWKSSMAG